MTGLYPPEYGLRVKSEMNRLGAAVPVLSEQFGARGYGTGAFVGAFVLDCRFGLDRGFTSMTAAWKRLTDQRPACARAQDAN